MKTISVDEFRANLDRYLVEVRTDDLLVMDHGRPVAWFRGVSQEMDEDSHYFADDLAFWEMIRERRKGEGIPWEEAKRQLDLLDTEA
jgi:antitoxin (DNA-binding transcriptional repressor) of toxin-antitoxin stability system